MTDTLPTPGTQSVEEFVKDQTQQGDLQADLAKAKSLTVGEVPVIQDSVDPHVDLPRGLMHNGAWNTRAVVRELTGIDEESLARVKDITEIYDTVLALGTVRIGQVELEGKPLPDRQGLLLQLLLGERDMLFVGIVRMTYGDRKTMGYVCPACGEKQELTVVLSEDFPVAQVENIQETTFSYTTSTGDVLTYRPAVGSDQMEAIRRKGSSVPEQNSILLSRCIKSVNGNEVILDPLLYARKLPLRDRHGLLAELVSRQPTVDMTVKFDCAVCREEQTVALGWADLFQP